jgi:hopanoid biosynthesis associated protein HpnK
VRRLIINADDFGLTGGVNRAIIECHQAGSVTSTTLMANSGNFKSAVDLAHTHPSLGVGCHVMLVDGQPLLPAEKVRSLLAPDEKVFRSSAAAFARAAVRKQVRAEEIAFEASAQISKLQSAGVKVTHIDTHKHTHIFPRVLKPLLETAQKFGIQAVRNPFGAVDVAISSALLQAPKVWLRKIQMKLLHRYSGDFSREVKAAGMRTTDGTFGILATGSFDERTLHAILDAIPDGTWEVVCHPGYNDSALDSVKTRLRQSRVVEREILSAPNLRHEIQRRGIELINFGDL